MRRENREKERKENQKTLFYMAGSIAGIAVIILIASFILYGGPEESEKSVLDEEQISSLVPSVTDVSDETISQASSEIGKTVEEAKKEEETNKTQQPAPEQRSYEEQKPANNIAVKKEEPKVEEDKPKEEEKPEEQPKEINFSYPVEGELAKVFAKDNLIYSETLKEWVTHSGIDIKADKTTVVKASSDGVVKTIKNDPRYGLTVTIEHENGFLTVYANLLTAEFIEEGEKVTARTNYRNSRFNSNI